MRPISKDGLSNRPYDHNESNRPHHQNEYDRPYGGLTLGSVIKLFKGNVTKYAIKNNIPFARQSRYHDHIVRDEGEYDRIKYYIQTNPDKRGEDTHYTDA
ncbi:MAG: hypothetical protein NZL83_04805 [Candidatus Absconditabacterales bacterium]|nr:hypothetical protein [Candidatus Absconditabacterales bacterium]